MAKEIRQICKQGATVHSYATLQNHFIQNQSIYIQHGKG